MSGHVVAVLVVCGEIDAACAFESERDASLWAAGAYAGCEASNMTEVSVYVLPRDAAQVEERNDYLRVAVVEAARQAVEDEERRTA